MPRTAHSIHGGPQTDARICVVGAGPCGLTTLKNLKAVGIKHIACYDDGDAVGGNWVFRKERQSVFATTHLISSKKLSSFEDYPFPTYFPDFPSQQLMRSYFEDYARHFGLMGDVHLNTHVKFASLLPDGRWMVVVIDSKGEREEVFDYLISKMAFERNYWIKRRGSQRLP
ncbi:MAG: hypothetical protein KF874_10410 [Rhizobiaceae bacterium]|nr:hypothetical protein [Rhizobiaceae bacterium]